MMFSVLAPSGRGRGGGQWKLQPSASHTDPAKAFKMMRMMLLKHWCAMVGCGRCRDESN